MRSKKKQLLLVISVLLVIAGCNQEDEPEIKALEIQEFAPTEVTPGTIVTIQGQGFSDSLSHHQITLNRGAGPVESTVINVTRLSNVEYLFFYPPAGIDYDTYSITLKVNNDSVDATRYLRVTERPDPRNDVDNHVLQSIDTTRGQPGDSIAITGYNYTDPSDAKEDYTVTIGETNASIGQVDQKNDQITLHVALPDLSAGHYGIQVSTENKDSENILHFEVIDP